MESFKERLLKHYSLSERGYEELVAPLSFASLPSIDEEAMAKRFKERLLLAKEKGERVLIYGDYDADGVMSTSILLRSLRELGLYADGYLPSRYLDGYGANPQNVEKIASKGYKILFCTDNGVTAHQTILKAKELGMEVLILDHHEFDETEPETPYILHPKRLGYGKGENCAGFLAFLLSKTLLNRTDPYLLLLGATATLGDAMPLNEKENRDIVRLGLEVLNKNRYPEFELLRKSEEYTESDLQMYIVPRINAVGRLEKGTLINRLLQYFGNPESPKLALSKYILEVYAKRKTLTETALTSIKFDPSEPTLVLRLEVPEGINGLLASRFEEESKKPVAIFSKKEGEEGLLVGSLRAPDGFSLVEAFEHMKVPFVHKGGHPGAAGATIRESDFELFKKELNFLALKEKVERKKEDALPLLFEELTRENLSFYRSLAPFGKGFEAPSFRLPPLSSADFTYLKDGKYLSLKKGEARVFSFLYGKDSFLEEGEYRFLGSLRENLYKGKRTPEFLVTSFEKDFDEKNGL